MRGDQVARRVTLQPGEMLSPASTEALHRSGSSSSPDLDCNAMTSFDSFSKVP